MTRCTCSVFGCVNSSYTTDLTFFRLPSVPEKFARWLKLMNREDLNDKVGGNYYICEAHFDPNAILISLNKKLLRRTAEPTLHLPAPSADATVRISRSSQYDLTDLSPRKGSKNSRKNRANRNHSMEEKKQRHEEKKAQKNYFDNLCDEFLSKEISILVKSQASLRFQFFKNKFDTDFKNFCLKVYHSNPHAYSFLRETLDLPKKKELVRLYAPFITEDLKSLTKVIKTKVECMTETEKNCSILVRTVRLKPHLFYHIGQDKIIGFEEKDGDCSSKPAKYAVVVMICGIYDDWKLPIGYSLLSNKDETSICSYFDTILTKLLEIGLNIQICISNLRSDVISVTKDFPVTKDKPFFFFIGKQIFFIQDPMCLMIKIKTLFTKYEFHFQGHVAKWQDIVEFYNKDSNKKHKLAPQLTHEHIQFIQPRRMNGNEARLVEDLFSENVASGISMYVDFNQIGESAEGTVQFIDLMSKLFKCFNSKHSNDIQVNYFKQALTFFRQLSVYKNGVNITSKLTLINEVQITLKGLMLLLNEFTSDGNPPMVIKHLSVDPLNKSLALKQTSNGNPVLPSPWTFIKSFRKTFFYHVMKPIKGKYSENVAHLLGKLYKRKMPKIQVKTNQPKTSKHAKLIVKAKSSVKMADYRDLELPDINQFLYLYNYLHKKVLDKHKNCNEIKHDYYKFVESSSSNDMEEYNPEAEEMSKNTLIFFLENAEADLQYFFKSFFSNSQVIQTLVTRNNETNNTFVMPCSCFPVEYLRDLYFRVRIVQLLKANNKSFRKGPSNEMNFQYANLT